MIDLKVDKGKCSLSADGESSKLSFEIIIAAHSLTKTLANVTGMTFEAAALSIMQGSSLAHKALSDIEKNSEF